MEEENPLPLARMVSISRPSFWIFLAACFVLFICEWVYDHGVVMPRLVTQNYLIIMGVAFTGLFLNIIPQSIHNAKTSRTVMICTYIFEVVSVIVIGFLIFQP